MLGALGCFKGRNANVNSKPQIKSLVACDGWLKEIKTKPADAEETS